MYDIAFDPYRFHTSFGLEEAIKHQESKEKFLVRKIDELRNQK